jgi:hypothetical protein
LQSAWQQIDTAGLDKRKFKNGLIEATHHLTRRDKHHAHALYIYRTIYLLTNQSKA